MLAVHFGAGNIGRGFIGALLSRSGYEVCFVDIQGRLVETIRERRAYKVHLLEEEDNRIDVNHVTALNSRTEPERVIEAVAGADLVTTAVGPSVLKSVAPILTDGLCLRLEKDGGPLNVIACENMLGGSSLLKKLVTSEMTEEECREVDSLIGFPDAAVDRIVPEQKGTDRLEVAVEPFYEWVVDVRGVRGTVPPIQGVTYVKDLTPYIERKLFTVNTGHAVCAYLGYIMGYGTVQEAIADPSVSETLRGALEETGEFLVQKHGFDPRDHQKYIEEILNRFRNPHLKDPVTRVGRSPLRKLGREDRLLGPALQMMDRGIQPNHLAVGIAAALCFDDPADPEAVKLQRMIKREGPAGTLQAIAGIAPEHPLVRRVREGYRKLRQGT
ncbi:mannitol-1-phosphate 5-dehydrogenase [Kroppenstedtia guangzhouensis]|uniref:Mannitol-1-phosphate 5-dehydrogenase n=1 Tax=Kroppenstedtia guangzhouensis TaxID=1274356 RepID=A0ABQ1GES2_9BACL|nr:mannitol-1-phosphate 5-dehydrogenase [Kroppenstedtia guangzhouensis]GGA42304.1 mannitol-1-phosphate 5-dehydrogenase [Kroppenstedtia guangzhouensis]